MAVAGKTGRGSAALSGAGTGASIGATVGGLPGAAIGAGIGAAGAAIFGGSELGAMNEEELAELKRRKELGLLGYSDEAQAVLQAEIAGPGIRLAAERSAQLDKQMATQNVGGSGATAKMFLEETARDQEMMQDSANKIATMDLKKRLDEEARMAALTGEISAQQQADQKEAFAGIVSIGETLGDVRKADQLSKLSIDELRALKSREDAVKGIGVDTKDQKYEEFLSVFQQIYGA